MRTFFPSLALSLVLFACEDGNPAAPLPDPEGGYEALAIGIHHGCGVRAEGTFCWGMDQPGELGDGRGRSSPRPVEVSGGHAFEEVRLAGSHSCALTSDGAAFCWGAGASGALGNGSAENRGVPTAVTGGPFRAIRTGGGFTCALDSGGAVWCWGAN